MNPDKSYEVLLDYELISQTYAYHSSGNFSLIPVPVKDAITVMERHYQNDCTYLISREDGRLLPWKLKRMKPDSYFYLDMHRGRVQVQFKVKSANPAECFQVLLDAVAEVRDPEKCVQNVRSRTDDQAMGAGKLLGEQIFMEVARLAHLYSVDAFATFEGMLDARLIDASNIPGMMIPGLNFEQFRWNVQVDEEDFRRAQARREDIELKGCGI